MNFILHPLRAYHRFENWRERRRRKCVVYTDNPPMEITGQSYECIDHTPNPPFYLDSSPYFAFFRIPYAETPPERFQPPEPLEYMTSPIIVNACWGDSYPMERINMYDNEDRLYLNIYMPNKPKVNLQNPLPVMVFIHGDNSCRNLHVDGNEDISPINMIKQNLIFVAVHYRTGIYGFLNLETENCKGNAGLKDQVQALKWIRDNIDEFGGDPNNVTLCGHGSGATCVNLHMISPLSQGLFHKAIVMAGGINCPWGFKLNERKVNRIFDKELSRDMLKRVMVDDLKKMKSSDMLRMDEQITEDRLSVNPGRLTAVFGPSIEAFENDAFLPPNVKDFIKKIKPVPVLTGIVEYEGYMYIQEMSRFYRNSPSRRGFSELVNKVDEFTEFLMKLFSWGEDTVDKHMAVLRERYLNVAAIDIELALAKLVTDVWFHRFYDNFKIGSNHSTLYVYKFGYLARNDSRRITRNTKKGINVPLDAPIHGDDLMHLFNPEYIQKLSIGQVSTLTKCVILAMCELWGDFCRKQPDYDEDLVYANVVWKPHTDEEPYYLRIGNGSEHYVAGVPRKMNWRRWEKMNRLVDSQLSLAHLELTHMSLVDQYLLRNSTRSDGTTNVYFCVMNAMEASSSGVLYNR